MHWVRTRHYQVANRIKRLVACGEDVVAVLISALDNGEPEIRSGAFPSPYPSLVSTRKDDNNQMPIPPAEIETITKALQNLSETVYPSMGLDLDGASMSRPSFSSCSLATGRETYM